MTNFNVGKWRPELSNDVHWAGCMHWACSLGSIVLSLIEIMSSGSWAGYSLKHWACWLLARLLVHAHAELTTCGEPYQFVQPPFFEKKKKHLCTGFDLYTSQWNYIRNMWSTSTVGWHEYDKWTHFFGSFFGSYGQGQCQNKPGCNQSMCSLVGLVCEVWWD